MSEFQSQSQSLSQGRHRIQQPIQRRIRSLWVTLALRRRAPRLAVASLLPALLAAPLALPGLAQRPLNEIRALNFARNTGVTINGGLIVYRPQACMFTTSAESNPCLIRSDEEGFTYRFLGGPPGWQADGGSPTLETEILVAPDGNSLVRVLYNGPPRPRSGR